MPQERAEKRIDQLPVLSEVTGTERLPIEDDGVAKSVTVETLLAGTETGQGLTEEIKTALLTIARKVAYVDEHGQTYYDALYNALYPPAELLTITASFAQGSHVVYDTDSLDSLKPYLVVTAHYDDNTDTVVSDYALSGTLAEGTSTITVSYGGKVTTFSVMVTHSVDTTVELTDTDKILVKDSNFPNNEYLVNRPNGGVTIRYKMDTPTTILYPAGIIPTYGTSVFGSGSPNPSLMVYDASEAFITGGFVNIANRWAQDKNGTMTEFSQSWDISGAYSYIRFTVDARYIDDAYMYDKTTGQIWFAGKNTPYYRMSNISEAGG